MKKKILFRVVGNDEVGMGHIYRTLSLAREFPDCEVLFVADKNSDLAFKQLSKHNYYVGRFSELTIVKNIVILQPDLVINDVLDTTKQEIMFLKNNGIKVVNFEDLGCGAVHADITINELYDNPKFSGKNVLWGMDYFFVRDEFLKAKPCQFGSRVTDVLFAFGGTDQHDLSRKLYRSTARLFRDYQINLHIVTGPGYKNYRKLADEVAAESNVYLTHATGVISRVMERVQLAVTSNGRAVYELAHMNVPSIVVSQHDRERTHMFACKENGVIPLGLYQEGVTESMVVHQLDELVNNTQRRSELYKKTKNFSFSGNKKRVVSLIRDLLSRSSNDLDA